jgi:hypothetical protein
MGREGHCSPPLAMERESVLDQYFDNITADRVESEQEGWSRLGNKPLRFCFGLHLPLL